MLQKRNDYEIIEKLTKSPKHIRLLGKELNLIPSTVMRIMRRLEEERVTDFKIEGKNKIYFLKDTLEAKNYILMSEIYKLNKITQNARLRRVIKELKEQTNGELIILFGSYAKSTERKESDIDIYIESNDNKLKKNLSKISEKLSIKIGKLDKENLLTKEIMKNHIIIQNFERYYQLIK